MINWTLTRQNLLLDWIDTHPEERTVLFSEIKQLRNKASRLSKATCAIRAAAAIFAEDSDTEIRKEALENPEHFWAITGDVIRNKSVYSCISRAECRLLSAHHWDWKPDGQRNTGCSTRK